MKDLSSTNESRKRFIIIIVVISLILIILAFTAKDKLSATANKSESYSNGMYKEADLMVDNAFTESVSATPEPKSISVKNIARVSPSPIEKETRSSDNALNQDKKYIIKTGQLSIKVFSLNSSIESISKIAKSNGGDITSTDINPQSKYGYLTLKVSVDKFENALNQIKAISSLVQNESISTNDATRQVIDLNATLKNKKAQEDRLREFFDRAENVNDLLAIEKNLTTVRGEIGRIEARLKSLTNQTSFSTITVNVTEDTEILPSQSNWRPMQVAKNAVNSLIKKMQHIVDSAIDISISSLPIFILSLFALWFAYVIVKKVFKQIIKKTKSKDINNITE